LQAYQLGIYTAMPQLLWTQKQDVGPAARSKAAMVFDAGQRRIVLFGGLAADNSSSFNDTWEWDGENWTQYADIGPAARSQHATAYDGKRGRAVLFGGVDGNNTCISDTWEWDGEAWTQVADTGPAPRGAAAMAYDSKRGRSLLFGRNNGASFFGDTWTWDGASWTQEQDTGPPPRSQHGLDYDSGRDRVVLFGGMSSSTKTITVTVSDNIDSGGFSFLSPRSTHTEQRSVMQAQFFNDAWEYDGAVWTRVADTGPAPRSGSGLVYNGKTLLLFGGNDNGNSFKDTWQWDGKHWTERQDIGPAARAFAGAAFDGARQRMVVFGGSAAKVYGDTWEAFERPLPADHPT
jgi:galactose oxidase-like protein/Kelch motif protein